MKYLAKQDVKYAANAACEIKSTHCLQAISYALSVFHIALQYFIHPTGGFHFPMLKKHGEKGVVKYGFLGRIVAIFSGSDFTGLSDFSDDK